MFTPTKINSLNYNVPKYLCTAETHRCEKACLSVQVSYLPEGDKREDLQLNLHEALILYITEIERIFFFISADPGSFSLRNLIAINGKIHKLRGFYKHGSRIVLEL